MTSGTSRGAQRDELLTERDSRLLEMMKQGRPIRAMAKLEGLEPDYAGKICAGLAKQHGIDYHPEGKRQQHKNALPPGLSDRTSGFRRRAATALYLWVLRSKRHPLEVCRDTGLSQAGQRAACLAHGPYDWSLSELDRWSQAMNVTFEELILDLTFDEQTATRMKACLKKD